MKQKIEDCCAAADNIRVNSTKEFGQMLDHFQEWCAGEIKKKSDNGEGKIVPMTNQNIGGVQKEYLILITWCDIISMYFGIFFSNIDVFLKCNSP